MYEWFDNNKKSCSLPRKKVPHLIDFKAVGSHNGYADSVRVKRASLLPCPSSYPYEYDHWASKRCCDGETVIDEYGDDYCPGGNSISRLYDYGYPSFPLYPGKD